MFRHDLMHSGSSSSTAPNTNQTLWKFNTGGQVDSPVVAGGVVYAGSYDCKVYALSASNGHLIWNYKTGDMVVSSPAAADGVHMTT
jgi:outer membrane protein assembly factor BamB